MPSDPRPASPGAPSPRATLIALVDRRWTTDPAPWRRRLSSLAGAFEVLVVEAPIFFPGRSSLSPGWPAPGVEVLTPRTPELAPGFCERQIAWLASLLTALVAERGIADPVAWLCTPLALPLLEHLEPRAIVYDCLDAPAAPSTRHRELLGLADVVLADDPAAADACLSTRADVHVPAGDDPAPLLRLLEPFTGVLPASRAAGGHAACDGVRHGVTYPAG